MKRRDFLASSLLGAAAGSNARAKADAGDIVHVEPKRRATEALPLRDLAAQYRSFLFDDFLPFMDRYVIDHRYGGFMCNTGHDGVRADDNKSTWFEGRGAWVYAFLYNNLTREQKYLDVAHRSLEFILKARTSEGLWPSRLTRQGEPLTPPDEAIYGMLFIAEGLAEYSKATGEKAKWEQAKDLVMRAVAPYDSPEYQPAIGQTYLGPAARPFPGARILGVWMVLLRVVSQMLEIRADQQLEKLADRCLDAVLKHHFNPAFGLYNELLNHDLSRPANEYSQLVYTGHAIEIQWMMMHEALRRKDRRMFDLIAQRFKRHVEVAWDDVYGGVFRNLQNVEQNLWSLDKVLWAQEEVLIGALCVVEQNGAPWAVELFTRTLSYVLDKYPLRAHGSPLWIYASDRQVSYEEFLRRPKRVENYHHPRHLMLNLLALERMMKTQGT
ncbi:MAG: AGE family epimerase/isomerase [Acidobacteriota bacterium]